MTEKVGDEGHVGRRDWAGETRRREKIVANRKMEKERDKLGIA